MNEKREFLKHRGVDISDVFKDMPKLEFQPFTITSKDRTWIIETEEDFSKWIRENIRIPREWRR